MKISLKPLRFSFLILLLTFLSLESSAQPLKDGTNLEETQLQYVVLTWNQDIPLLPKQTILVDYGEAKSSWLAEDNKKKKFTSRTHLINFMYENGWAFVQAYIEEEKIGAELFKNTRMVFKREK